MASSLIRGAALFGAEALRDPGFLRGELAFLAAGFGASPFSAVSSAGAFDLSVSFAFVGMTKTGIAVLDRIGFASRFRKGLA